MKRTIKRLYINAGAFAMLALIAGAGGVSAQGRGQDCSKLVVGQSYAHVFEGLLNVPEHFTANHLGTPPEGVGIVPTAGGGILTFLPDGKVTGRLTLSIGLLGVYPDLSVDSEKSTYSLAQDPTRTPSACSGTLRTVTAETADDFQLVASADGQRIEAIHTGTGLVVSLTGTRIDASGCSNRTIEGDYVYNVRGWGLAGGPFTFPANQLLSGYFPFAFSGAMTFRSVAFPRSSDPGTVEFWDTVSGNGMIYPRIGSGSYALKPECTGTLTLTDSTGIGFHLDLVVDQKSGDIYMVNVDTAPGTPIPGFIVGTILSRAAKQ